MRLVFLARTICILAVAVTSQAASAQQAAFTPGLDFTNTFSALTDKTTAIEFGVGAALSLSATALDHFVRDDFAHQHRWGELEHVGNDFLGTGVPGVVLGLGLMSYGYATSSLREQHVGLATVEALLSTYALTFALKGLVQRRRPDNSDNYSFPSAHTSTVAASAAVLSEMYGWKVGVPAYLLVLVTAEGRWGGNRHWFSDTVSGAVLGTLVGQAFARGHEMELKPTTIAGTAIRQWRFSPFLVEDGAGVSAVASW